MRGSFWAFQATVVAIVLGFLTVFALSLYQSGRENAASKAAALEQYVRRSLEVSAAVAKNALGYLERRGSLEGLAEDFGAYSYFSDLEAGMSLGEGMIFVDGDGRVVLNSGAFPAAPVDLSDRGWFRDHLEGADRALGGSFVSRVTGTLIFVHTYALRDADGTLLGVVNIGIPSDEILGAQALPFEDEAIVTTVLRRTGHIIARDPYPEDLIGARLEVPAAVAGQTVSLERRPVDGRLALTAYSPLDDFGLLASVSVPLAMVFQPLMLTAAVMLPLLALILLGARSTLRHLESQQRQLQRSAIRLETVLQASSLGAWQWFPQSDRTEFLGRYAEMLGYRREDLAPDSSTWRRFLHPDEREHLLDSFDRLLRGESEVFREEHRMRHRDGHWVWVLDSARVVERDADGYPEIVIGVHLDISERREAEERMHTVSREVDHRSKNLLAVVQALVSMTRLDSEKSFKATLRGRIHAMSRAHELLSRSRWEGAELQVIAEGELAAYMAGGAAEVVVDGPPAVVEAAATQPLAMTLHELATNAAKYGALSAPGGRLRLTWTIPEHGPTFTMLWEETFGRRSEDRPGDAGFGSRLMRLMIEEQLGGSLQTDWTDGGLRCRIEIPKSLLLRRTADQPPETAAPAAAPRIHASGAGARVLLVEDEALLAAEMATRLETAGHVVACRASTLRQARSLAADADIDAAVLDVNLRGEASFPVAEILRGRGVPFVFVTGYQYDHLIPGRFGHAPVVRKPSPPGAVERALAEAMSHSAQAKPVPAGPRASSDTGRDDAPRPN